MSLEEENRQLKDARLCKVCMDDDVAVVFLPCGHLGKHWDAIRQFKTMILQIPAHTSLSYSIFSDLCTVCPKCDRLSVVSNGNKSIRTDIFIVKNATGL